MISTPAATTPIRSGFRQAALGNMACALTLAALAIGAASTVAVRAQTDLAAALKKAGADLSPLLVLGDVNEDGSVDAEDLKLIGMMVQSSERRPNDAISCPAAADLTQNSAIDQRDLDIITGWLSEGRITGPALSANAYLGCDFKQYFVAAGGFIVAGGTLRLRYLDDRYNAGNSEIVLDAGLARIAPSIDQDGFDIEIPADAKAGDGITVRIDLLKSRSYFYTVTIRDIAGE